MPDTQSSNGESLATHPPPKTDPAPMGIPDSPDSPWDVYWPPKDSGSVQAVRLASFPMILYFWPTLIAFLTCGFLQGLDWAPAKTLGWVALATLCFNLVVLVTDFDQKKSLIMLLSLALLAVLAWVSSLKDWGLVEGLNGWLGGLEITLSTHAYYLVAGLLVLFSIVGLINPRVDYWRFEPNEFVHYIQPFGRDQSVPRQGSTVTREVPDILEYLLSFGGGTLVIRRDGEAVARIPHIPMLGRRMQSIERLLGVTRVESV